MTADKEQDASADESDREVRPLLESALYKENIFENGHSSVWGSWFDAACSKWGYACCHGTARAEACLASSLVSAAVVGDRRRGDIVASGPSPYECVAGTDEANGLRSREEFADSALFIMHWIRAALQEWRKRLTSEEAKLQGDARFATFSSMDQLKDAERAIAPLFPILVASSSSYLRNERVHVWSQSARRWMKDGQVLEVLSEDRTVGDSVKPGGSIYVAFGGGSNWKWLLPDQLEGGLRKAPAVELRPEELELLERIAVETSKGKYAAANQAYMELSIGHGKWHESLSVGGTGSNKAPRGGCKVHKDRVGFLDTEEAKAYMFCVKRLIAFMELTKTSTKDAQGKS
mmetsp:Transcript_416/g.1419  ORF Transcript_416/g.1419 Transcript_416/m.1419 type:complete len:347 (+) Transcript_416:109-1149(+)